MASSSFGWDLLYQTIKDDVRNNSDVLVAFTHLVLISNGFKCIGLGDSKVLDGTETKSEVLPHGWNDSYTIRYVHQGRLYILKATDVDDAIMINIIRVAERSVSMVQLNKQVVAQRTGSLEQMIPNNEEIAQNIKRQLVDKVTVSSKHHDTSSQTERQQSTSQPIIPAPIIQGIPRTPAMPYLIDPLPHDIGRSDLEPLGGVPGFPRFGGVGGGVIGGGGSGNLFVPPRIQGPGVGPNLGVVPGSIPPGARFDPFRPPDPDAQFLPSAGGRQPGRNIGDDMPPPGYDDMFM